jgi:hypothetical protein
VSSLRQRRHLTRPYADRSERLGTAAAGRLRQLVRADQTRDGIAVILAGAGITLRDEDTATMSTPYETDILRWSEQQLRYLRIMQVNGSVSLDIPDWVPAHIADLTRTLYPSAVLGPPECFGAHAEGILRVATDERMREVWKELRRRQLDGSYVHPARQVRTHPRFQAVENISHQPDDRDRAQEQATALLFLDATGILLHDRRYDWGPKTWTQAEVRQKVRILEELAKQHEDQAKEYDRLGQHRYARILRELAADDREQAAGNRKQAELRRPDTDDHWTDPWMVERRSNRWNDWDRGTIIEIACACRRLFDKPLLGTVTTLSNVVLDRGDITEGGVQGVVKHIRVVDA